MTVEEVRKEEGRSMKLVEVAGKCLALLKAWIFLQKKHKLRDLMGLNFHFKIRKVNSVPRLIFF